MGIAALGLFLATAMDAAEPCFRAPGLDGVAGFYNPSLKFQHAIVANNGAIHDVWIEPPRTVHDAQIARLRDTVSIAGYNARVSVDRDTVIAARKNGEIHQIWFKRGAAEIGSQVLAVVPDTIDVAAFYEQITGMQHAIVLTASGEVIELTWLFAPAVGRNTLTRIPGATHVAGFIARDDGYNIVLVATSGGQVWELFYKDPRSVGQSVILTAPEPIVDLAGFYTPDDQFRHAIVALAGGGIQETFYHPVKGKGTAPLTTMPGVRYIAGYGTDPDDRWRHVILGMSDGSVQEFRFNPAVGSALDPLRTYPPQFTIGEDTSPEGSNRAQPQVRPAKAGMMLAVTGNDYALYGVSPNAGVWSSTGGTPWKQLSVSPPRAYSIAMDPANASHIVVGERYGDSVSPALDRSGVWESRNGGTSWRYVLNPRTLAGCAYQAIPALTFDDDGNLYVATECGVAKRDAGATAFTLLTGTSGTSITNVVTRRVGGATWVWARDYRQFLLSKDAGATWEWITIPSTIGIDTILHGSRGEHFSLAAFETSAFTIANSARTGAVLVLDGNTKTWSIVDVRDGDGTGLGGRRFVKAYFVTRPLPQWIILAGTGQGMFLGEVAAGRITGFRRILETPWPLGRGESHEFNPVSHVHVDLWDAHVADAADPLIWTTADGGIYRTNLLAVHTALATGPGITPKYVHINEGLKTHHAHTLTLLTENPVLHSKLVYTTSDNDEWLRNSIGIWAGWASWRQWDYQGDSNWSDGDNGSSPIALIIRNGSISSVSAFGEPAPPAAKPWAETPRNIVVYPAEGFHGEQHIHVIQTAKNEAPNPLLDVVMLSHLPLNAPDPANAVVLIRSRTFAANPDHPTSKFAPPAWTIEDSSLPPGAQRIWAAGGRNIQGGPVYYLYAEDGFDPKIYRRAAAGALWKDLTPALGAPLLSFYRAMKGPLFPNPYDPAHLIVLTAAGVRVSTNGGATFSDDAVLTALITGSGTYPINDRYFGGSSYQVVDYNRTRRVATLSDVAFLRDGNGAELVVSSPYTGLFHLDRTCGTWRTLTQFLPKPLSPATTVGIDHEAVYTTISGRGVWRVLAYELAPTATYYRRDGLAAGQMAKLVFADGGAVAGAHVRTVITKADGTEAFNGTIVTDAAGVLATPVLPPGSCAVHVEFTGAMSSGASAASFFL